MSTKERYFDSLDDAGRQRYLDKLAVSAEPVREERPICGNKFKGLRERYVTLAVWPPVEFGHISCFFIHRP